MKLDEILIKEAEYQEATGGYDSESVSVHCRARKMEEGVQVRDYMQSDKKFPIKQKASLMQRAYFVLWRERSQFKY